MSVLKPENDNRKQLMPKDKNVAYDGICVQYGVYTNNKYHGLCFRP